MELYVTLPEQVLLSVQIQFHLWILRVRVYDYKILMLLLVKYVV